MKPLAVISAVQAAGSATPRRAHITVAKGLAALAAVLLLSVLLVPSGVELAWWRARSGQTDSALRLLEAAYAKGDHSSATVIALARQRAQSGKVDDGLALLQEFAAKQPGDTTLLEALADMAPRGGRTAEVIASLAQLQRLKPDVSRQRLLVRLHGEQGDTRSQSAALSELLDRFDSGDVADHLLLSRLQSQQGEHGPALATLERMVRKFPASNDASVVAAQMTAQLASGDAAGATSRARARLRERTESADAEAPVLAGAMMAAGRPDLATPLLDALVTAPQPDARVLGTWAQAMSDSGRAGAALARIDKAPADSLDAALQTLRLDLALMEGKADGALAALRSLGPQAVSLPALFDMANLALTTRNKEALSFLRDTAEEGVARYDPLLAARIAEALGDREATLRWSRLAASESAREPAKALQLARLLERAGQNERASGLLRRVDVPIKEPSLLGEYARLHIALGSAPAGLAALSRALGDKPERGAPHAWALLATASGQHEDVHTWLKGLGSARTDEQLLRDIHHLAMQGKAPGLALAAAERLDVGGRASDRDTLLLISALAAAGQNAEAARQLSVLRQRVSAKDEWYADLLLLAWRQGEPVNAELRKLLTERLARRPASAATRESDVSVLLELGAHAEALGALERLAAADPKRWLSAYLDSAGKAGQRRRTAVVLTRLAENQALPETLRGQIAFRLLEAGDKVAAERAFRALAANSGPREEATQRLLYVWGPRPTPPQREWLEARADRAVGRDRADWMRLLTERGGAAQAIKVYRRISWPTPDGDDVIEAYLEALAASGDRAGLAGSLQQISTRTRSSQLLGRLARQAATLDDAALERRLIEAALDAGNADPALRRALGLLAHRAKDLRTAEPNLVAYIERTGGDAATHHILGDIRTQRGDSAGARMSYENALAAHQRKPDQSFPGRLAKASLLQRLQRHSDAKSLYEELLAERPTDENLRADFAAMLLDLGQVRGARALLENR